MKTHNTNFAILVSKNFTEPFKSPIEYGKQIAQLGNMLCDGASVTRGLQQASANGIETARSILEKNSCIS